MKNIIKILFVCGLLFFFHVKLFKKVPDEFYAAQTEWQNNLILAQKFLYNHNDNNIENMIIGTSLSMRLKMDELQSFTNLSFGGISIFTGLHLVNKIKMPPKRVFIEINVIDRLEDKHFLSLLYSPVLYPFKKHFRYIREDRQPMVTLGFLVRETITKTAFKNISLLKKVLAKKKALKKIPTTNPKNTRTFYDISMEFQKKLYLNVPSDKIFKELVSYVHNLEEKKVEVVFFEMPVDPILCNMPKAIGIRKKMQKYFPVKNYSYITMPDCKNFKTSDGLHLPSEEALRYTNYFKKNVGLYLKNKKRNAGKIYGIP